MRGDISTAKTRPYSLLPSHDGLRMENERRMLSPHAELSSTSSTSWALTLLAARERAPGPSSTSSGPSPRPLPCPSCHALGSPASAPLPCRVGRGGVRCGDEVGISWIESPLSPLRGGPARLRRFDRGDAGSSVKGSAPRIDGPGPASSSSCSTKISGTVNCGTAVRTPAFLRSMWWRKRRDQYTVSKKPMTMLRRTASSTRCSRALRLRNSCSRRLLLSLMTL